MAIKQHKEGVITLLQEQIGYGHAEAEEDWARIEKYPAILQAILAWAQDSSRISPLRVEGISYEWLVTERKQLPMQAFLSLVWLLESPDVAARALASKQDFLKRGS